MPTPQAWNNRQTAKLYTKVKYNPHPARIMYFLYPSCSYFIFLNNSKNHVTQRKVYKLSRLIFVVPFFKHLKALWFCDRCSFNNPVMGTGWMNGASFEIRSWAVTAEATITHLFTTGVNCCYLRDSCISSQGLQTEAALQCWYSETQALLRNFKVILKS